MKSKKATSRCSLFRKIIGIILLGAIGCSVSGLKNHFSDRKSTEPLDRIHRLLKKHPLIDTHNDLPFAMRERGETNLNITDMGNYMTDITRMRLGGMGGQFWSCYIPCGELDPVSFTLEQIDMVKLIVEANDDLQFATSVADVERIFASGKIASLIGIEGGHQINNSTAVLRQYRELGVLYMTLTHTCIFIC